MFINPNALSQEALFGIAREYVTRNISPDDVHINVEQYTAQIVGQISRMELIITVSQKEGEQADFNLKKPEQMGLKASEIRFD